MITFITFLWPKQKSQMALPAVPAPYSAQHVNVLRNMLWRNYRLPHRFILMTPEHTSGHTHQNLLQAGLDPRIEVYPIYSKPASTSKYVGTYQDPACPHSPHNHPLEELAGCFKRLTLHTEATAERLRLSNDDLIVQIDLDCIILDDVTSLFDPSTEANRELFFPAKADKARPPFKINNYNAPIYTELDANRLSGRYPRQEYNGALQFFKPKALHKLHDDLLRHPDPWAYIRTATENGEVIGSDQAWITLFFRKKNVKLAEFTNTDGVYEFRQFKPAALRLSLGELQSTASEDIVNSFYSTPAGQPKIIFFAGPSDPSIARDSVKWVKEAWR